MRGEERRQRTMLMVVNMEERISKEHPLRRIKSLADAALRELSSIFDQMYSALGRPSIPPERLLKASLLMALYTTRSERMFCEQLDYNLLFRWFLDMELDQQLRPFELHHQPRAAAEARGGRRILPANCRPGASAGAALE